MIDGFTEAQVTGGLVAFLAASYAAFFGWLVTGIHTLRRDMHALNRETRLELGSRIETIDQKLDSQIDAVDRRLSSRIDALDQKLGTRIDTFDQKLSTKIDALTIAVSRLEGAVYHGRPEPRHPI